MKRIVLDVSKGELDYIREAVEHKHKSLMTYFDACEAEANKPIEVQAWKDYFGAPAVANVLRKKMLNPQNEWTATMKEENNGNVTVKAARKPRKVAAPYGLKKDGTPKSKPGRKA